MSGLSPVSGNNYSYPLEKYGQKSDAAADGNSLSIEEDKTSACQTCKNRKYVDGSDEMVSFKSPAHVSPQASALAVRSHEQEHVTNAYSEAAVKNGEVLSASVTLKLSACPECGRSYISGGETRTQIKYYNEENPYQQDLKTTDYMKYSGMNTDWRL